MIYDADQLAATITALQDLSRDLGTWYDRLGKCDFTLKSTTFRCKRDAKLDSLDVNHDAQMWAVRELPWIVKNSAEQLVLAQAEIERLNREATV